MKRVDIGNFLIGFSFGAAAAVLLAPRSGDTTRTLIKEAASEGKDSILEYGKTVRHAVVSIVDQSKDYLAQQGRGIAEAIKQGSQAYREADLASIPAGLTRH